MSDQTAEAPRRKHTQMRFYRSDLDRLPDLAAPEGYILRTFQPGDETGWAALLRDSFNEPGWDETKIQKEFIDQPQFRPERIALVENDGEIVGVAAAWEREDPEEGYVHWVAVQPGHRGKKLGRLVTLATLHQFRSEGKFSAILDTDDFRIPACATYLSLGFLPLLDSPEREEMWDKVARELNLKE